MTDANQMIELMGTKIRLYFKGEQADQWVAEACALLRHYEQVFSANDKNSQLFALKTTAVKAPVVVDRDLYELIKIGKAHSLEPDSFLNIAIGPLIKLWRIGFKEARVPSQEEINNVLGCLDPANIVLDDARHSVFFAQEGLEIDLGAIAKGYFSDKVMDFFKEKQPVAAMVDIGGNLLVYGESPKNNLDWDVGIQNPFLPRGNCVAKVAIRNQSVVTSGIYERTFKHDGNQYHHIFDSHTGYPVDNNVASLSIIADQSLDCDIYTTKLFGLAPQSILETVNQIDGLEAVVITVDGQFAVTANLRNKVTMA
ncbi:FAD:protein FMN transferase [Vibrio gazogenes]|uniref:FAD:protein FMN transferase n=1 Tax=Vibrio gazogenes DSM 21264 = NBRC 103151 TaxID=1123492 RepID=A0A1M5HKL3_VIBGA|nr:FAD:protein FMN transferase [Vibrio gazogenes]USP14498.1 FAD:protein FMN transferase [Vibrio gazogenes]SHG16509.1 thiamine biosynthesis lipoprotein [Vibrio gazogenes DSM 21264] [Vibrio gazogenes DSM 21264 = NBRC 103151]SJN57651.1 Thiamine biosynthesis lipoprotein ApbE precursor [Vibrio gazogenes]